MSDLKTILNQAETNLASVKDLNLDITTTTSTESGGGMMKAFTPIRLFGSMPALPMLSLFFDKPALPTFYTNSLLSFYKPSDTIPASSITEGGCPVSINFEKFDINVPISSNAVVKEFTEEALNNLTSEFTLRKVADSSVVNDILPLADSWVTSTLLRSMEANMMTGVIPTTGALSGRGILGLIPTIVKVNGTIPANGTSGTPTGTNNGRYNTNYYTSSQTSQAIQDLMYTKSSLKDYSIYHCVIFIPLGTWQTFSMNWAIGNQMTPDTFKQIITNAEQNINAARGSRGSIYGDAHGRHYLDDSTDVVEVRMPDGNMILYPDVIADQYGFQEYSLTTPAVGLPGGNTIRSFYYASSTKILDMVGLNGDTYQQLSSNVFNGQNGICNGFAFGRSWKGKFVFANAAFAKLYTSVVGLTPYNYSVGSTVANGTVINLAV